MRKGRGGGGGSHNCLFACLLALVWQETQTKAKGALWPSQLTVLLLFGIYAAVVLFPNAEINGAVRSAWNTVESKLLDETENKK